MPEQDSSTLTLLTWRSIVALRKQSRHDLFVVLSSNTHSLDTKIAHQLFSQLCKFFTISCDWMYLNVFLFISENKLRFKTDVLADLSCSSLIKSYLIKIRSSTLQICSMGSFLIFNFFLYHVWKMPQKENMFISLRSLSAFFEIMHDCASLEWSFNIWNYAVCSCNNIQTEIFTTFLLFL